MIIQKCVQLFHLSSVVPRPYRTKSMEVNPNISGKESTSSLLSTGSDDASTSSSDSSDIDGMDSGSDSGGDPVTSSRSSPSSKYVSFQVSGICIP